MRRASDRNLRQRRHPRGVCPTLARDKSAVDLELRFSRSGNAKIAKGTIGLTASAALLSAPMLPPGSSSASAEKKSDESGKKNTDPNPNTLTEREVEHPSNSRTDAGRLLSTHYVVGFERDSVSLDSNAVSTQVSIPSGKWAIAGTFDNADVKAENKHWVLFVSAEAVEK